MKRNQEEWLSAAKEIASCVGVNVHELLSRTTPLLDLCPVPVRPAVEVLLSCFDMITEVQDQFGQSLRLIERSAKLLKGIRGQTVGLDDLMLPTRLSISIYRFEKLLIDIQQFIQSQIKRGWFKRFLFRHKLRAHLDDFDLAIDDVAQEFEILSHLSIHKRLTEEKFDRIQDNSQIRSMMSDALDNDEELLEQLQLQRSSIQSLEQALDKHIATKSKDEEVDKMTRRNKPGNVLPDVGRLSTLFKPISSNSVSHDNTYLSSLLKRVIRTPGGFK
ncbi:hypothetical protein E3P92_02243 [Wallemia ichthyophaga]|uniref:Fungal N-terminal domain-containing protein n=1 Tax=Wallemia ichthyophaga (strain EXF-994 / CBS 113033) TaxID=1299270 RepID=R9APE0_WALI9|nr:uncharacterized protein J056_003642 [Wallemia ichthyophaga EXF-994]EOR01966.1 hypothetical protein J056_003642 [Wallemia ichthyophaga EXF-994]TIB13377.1 hypothetical protein E3P92_02243 [Wallemia ichthyophaga]